MVKRIEALALFGIPRRAVGCGFLVATGATMGEFSCKDKNPTVSHYRQALIKIIIIDVMPTTVSRAYPSINSGFSQ